MAALWSIFCGLFWLSSTAQVCYQFEAYESGASPLRLGFNLLGDGYDYAGSSVSEVGDVNGDGLADVLIGAPGYLIGGLGVGKAYVIFGSRNATAWGSGVLSLSEMTRPGVGFVMNGKAAGHQSGYSVSGVGDVNGDGLADMLIGGVAQSYLIFGSRNATAWDLGTFDLENLSDGQHGFVLPPALLLSNAADFNGDGLDDMIFVPWGGGENGAIVLFGSRNAFGWCNSSVLNCSLTNGRDGFFLEQQHMTEISAADINGDNISDIIIGVNAKAYVLFGSRNTSFWGTGYLNLSSLMNGRDGFELSWTNMSSLGPILSVGDVNGDNIDDLIASDPSGNSSELMTGDVYVVFGSQNRTIWGSGTLSVSDMVESKQAVLVQGNKSTEGFGAFISAGDINGDSLSDIVIGTDGTGAIYSIFGSRNITMWGSGILRIRDLLDDHRAIAFSNDANYGKTLSITDVNSDGFLDLVLGMSEYQSPSQTTSGKVSVILGQSLLDFSANYLRLREGETVKIRSEFLALTTTFVNSTDTVRIQVRNCENGHFAFRSALGSPIDFFHMQDISDELIYFVHTGGVLAPRYNLIIDAVPNVTRYPMCSGVRVKYFNFAENQFDLDQQVSALTAPLLHEQVCYRGQACLPKNRAGIVFPDEQGGGFFVGGGGDFNGDGLADMLFVGISGFTYMVFGSRDPTVWTKPSLTLSNFAVGPRGVILWNRVFERSNSGDVVSTGDFNRDGFDDFIIGSHQTDTAYLIFGNSSWPAQVNLTSDQFLLDGQGVVLQGEPFFSSFFGKAVAGACDINGDGTSDIIVGSPESRVLGFAPGKTYVMFGTPNINRTKLYMSDFMDGVRGVVFLGQGSERSGSYVSCAGDVNGDGLDDLTVGNDYRTYVVFGSRDIGAWGSGTLNLTNLVDGKRGFLLTGKGGRMSSADINGDGLSDLLGVAYVLFGSRNQLVWGSGMLALGTPGFFAGGQRGFELTGEATDQIMKVLGVGDITGDGISDFSVLTRTPLLPQKFYVMYGSQDIELWRTGIWNITNSEALGSGFVIRGDKTVGRDDSASGVGDINGDGIQDLLAGAAGTTFLLFGTSFPIFFVANFLYLGSGDTVKLTPQDLAIASAYPDFNVALVPLVIEDLENGYFTTVSDRSVRLLTLFAQNITDGVILFTHNGGALAPRYRVVLNPIPGISSYPISAELQANFIGSRPSLVNNKLTVNQGGTTVLEAADLAASDQDNAAIDINFTISNLTSGWFVLYNLTTNVTLNVSSFNQESVLRGQIHFIHNGSRTMPSYEVVVSDSKTSTFPQPANIIFNYAPEMILIGTIVLDQGQATTLDPRNINASDHETFREALVIETDNVSNGYFAYVGNTNISITAFQQLSLISGSVQFVQNGSVGSPSFSLRVSDGVLRSPWFSARIYFNHRPVLLSGAPHQFVTQNDNFGFSLDTMMFFDSDQNDSLTYRAQLKGSNVAGGSPLPPEIQFRSPRYFSGNLPTVGSFSIQIEVSDRRGLKAYTDFILSSEESTAAYYRSVWTTVSGIGGTGLAILAYLWLRRRITKHRRGFVFANTLRKVLNLEYYDFMRFDGEVYKSKMDNFVQRMEIEHQEFFVRLTAAEKKSFAVCVAEILIQRRLVSRSSYGGGVFSCLCCTNAGWPSQLNLQDFEAQGPMIAKEAIAAWKAQQNPVVYWPYFSLSWKEKLRVFFYCQKAPSTSRWITHDIALTDLRRHEIDRGGSIDAFEEKSTKDGGNRVLSLEEQHRILQEQVRVIETLKETVDTMVVRIKTLGADATTGKS